MPRQLLCAALEQIINKALSVSRSDDSLLTSLSEKSLTVSLAELDFPLNFLVSQQQILVSSAEYDGDCQLKTSIKSLLALKKDQQITQMIRDEQLDIQGDIKVAQQFAQLAESIDVDWQTELAKHIGDVATYKLARVGKSLADKLKFFTQTVEQDAAEYVVYEQALVVEQYQLNDFANQVTEVQQQATTLSQRIDALLAKTK